LLGNEEKKDLVDNGNCLFNGVLFTLLLLLAVADYFHYCGHILGCEPTDGTTAVNSVEDLATGRYQETGGMKMAGTVLIKGACQGRNRLGIKAVPDLEGQTEFLHGLLRLIQGINRGGYDLDVQFLEKFCAYLKVQQLLAAVPSPISPVKQNDRPFAGKVSGDPQPVAVDCIHLQSRENVAGVEDENLFSWHLRYPFLVKYTLSDISRTINKNPAVRFWTKEQVPNKLQGNLIPGQNPHCTSKQY